MSSGISNVIYDATNVMTRRILITLNACIWKVSQINNLSFNLKKLEKAEWHKLKETRRKEIRAKILF